MSTAQLERIGDSYFYESDGVKFLFADASRSDLFQDWIGLYQIENEFPAFFEKASEILFDGGYSAIQKDRVRDIMSHLEMHEFISWTQLYYIILFDEEESRSNK